MKSVAIVMCTYNGEMYVKEQIDSLISQTYSNIHIYIKDDGSLDNTLDILSDYENRYSDLITVIKGDTGLHYPECFIKTLLQIGEYDYYAFCDQDDVWYPDKIQRAVDSLEKCDNRKNVLYFSAVNYCDSNLKHIRDSRFAINYNGEKELPTEIAIFGGDALGMTYVFNERVRLAIRTAYDNNYRSFKDGFIKILCAYTGCVVYEKEASAFYRRHKEATTSESNPDSKFTRYLAMIKQLFFDKNMNNDFSEVIHFISEFYSDEVLISNVKLFELFSSSKTLKNRIKRVFWKKRYRVVLLDEIGYRVSFAFNRF